MHISEINIYPVKSLKGISLQSAAVEKRGLKLDRRWLIVNADGKFLTQREEPKMATVSVELMSDGFRVAAAGGSSRIVQVPAGDASLVDAKVWNSESVAFEYDVETNEWFSEVLSREVRLLYMPEPRRRVGEFRRRLSAAGHFWIIIGSVEFEDRRKSEDRRAACTAAAADAAVQGESCRIRQ
jgi:uncharacterized protein YcbX